MIVRLILLGSLLLIPVGCASGGHENTPAATTSASTADPAGSLAILDSIEQQRAADRVLLANPEGFRSELRQATRLFDECVDEHITTYLSTSIAPELAARTTVAECGPRRWQPIVDLLDRAKFAGVKVDNGAIVDGIREVAHQRVVSALTNQSI